MQTYSVFGDSMSTFEGLIPEGNRVFYEPPQTEETGVTSPADTWWMQVIDRRGGLLLANGSFSGCMVQGWSFPAGCSQARIDQIAGPAGEAPDEILIFMGINDFGWAQPIYQVEFGSPSASTPPEGTPIPPMPPTNAGTEQVAAFAEAYEAMLAGIRSTYPDARVWCLTLLPGRVSGCEESTFCYPFRSLDLDLYNDAIKGAAARTGCEVADIRAFGYDYDTLDGTHPTKLGMTQLAEMTVLAMEAAESGAQPDGNALLGLTRPGTQEPLFDPLLRSYRQCTRESCQGCAYPQLPGSPWSLVCEMGMKA